MAAFVLLIVKMWWTKIHIQTYFVLASGLIGLITYNRLPLAFRSIMYLLFINVVVDVVATYLIEQKKANTNQLYSNFTVFEHIITLIIYSIQYTKKERILVLLFSIGLIGFSIYNQKNVQQSLDFNTYTFVPAALLISVLSYLLVRKMIIEGGTLYTSMLFWFAAANFVYFTIAVPILSAIPFAWKISISVAKSLAYVNYTAYAFWAILIAIGFLCQKKKSI